MFLRGTQPKHNHKAKMHVVVLVPFRHHPNQNRFGQLQVFLEKIPAVLREACPIGDSWEIIIAVQTEDDHKFCRGRVLNAAYMIANATSPHMTRIVLHDVDLIPDADRARGIFGRLPSRDEIVALNTTGEYRECTRYIGGIAALTPGFFWRLDGFPNDIEGWGGEDDSLRDGVSLIVPITVGTVTNLETEGTAKSTVRAKDDPECCMPRDDRRRIRELRQRAPMVGGLRDLAFISKPLPAIGESISLPLRVRAFAVNVFPSPAKLPVPWTRQLSRSSGRTYYWNPETHVTQWEAPAPDGPSPVLHRPEPLRVLPKVE